MQIAASVYRVLTNLQYQCGWSESFMLRNTCSYQYISKILRLPLIAGGVIVLLGGALWFIRTSNHNSIVGTWFVKASDAPFQYHMFVFNADGTMQQANPDAGDANTSDSDGKGIWKNDRNKVKGKFVEITADRVTHNFVSRGEILFEITVGKATKTLLLHCQCLFLRCKRQAI